MTTDKAQIYHAAARRYVQYGSKYGFCFAEFLLADFLPQKKKLSGKVCDIPVDRIPAFMEALKKPPMQEAA